MIVAEVQFEYTKLLGNGLSIGVGTERASINVVRTSTVINDGMYGTCQYEVLLNGSTIGTGQSVGTIHLSGVSIQEQSELIILEDLRSNGSPLFTLVHAELVS